MNDLTLIKNQIEELEAYRNKVTIQQLDYPIDINSKNIILGKAIFEVGSVIPISLATPFDESIEVSIDGDKYLIEAGQFVDIGI